MSRVSLKIYKLGLTLSHESYCSYCAKSTRCYWCECGNVVLEPATFEHYMFGRMLKCSSSFRFFNTAFVYIYIYLNFSPVSIYTTRMYRLSSIYRSPVNSIALQRARTAEQHSDVEAMCSGCSQDKKEKSYKSG